MEPNKDPNPQSFSSLTVDVAFCWQRIAQCAMILLSSGGCVALIGWPFMQIVCSVVAFTHLVKLVKWLLVLRYVRCNGAYEIPLQEVVPLNPRVSTTLGTVALSVLILIATVFSLLTLLVMLRLPMTGKLPLLAILLPINGLVWWQVCRAGGSLRRDLRELKQRPTQPAAIGNSLVAVVPPVGHAPPQSAAPVSPLPARRWWTDTATRDEIQQQIGLR